MVLRVCLESDFTVTIGTFEVETEDFDSQIGLLVAYFHSHVEFGSDVEIVGTSIAA